MAYATVEDVEARFSRELTDHERIVVENRLEDVEAMIKTRIPDLDEKIANGEISEQVVVMVEAEAVLRVIRNPDGFTQEVDGNYSYSMSSATAPGRLLIRDDEWGMLGVSGGIFTLRPYFKPPTRCIPEFPWWC